MSDPPIFKLMTKHKAEGYLVFMGTLEVYATEFKPEKDWKLVISIEHLKTILRVYHTNRLTICLQSIADL